ncbi:MAG: methyltransferase domain-containing protein [Chitinophagaceae bacterium]|jgi:methyl halide transferase|nr:methyltransferase domain-containing protein [Chitinophagaceae bacterium]
MTEQILDADWWSNRYLQQQTGWDIGYSSTPLQTYMNSVEDKNSAILIPGCGNSYEAEALLNAGFTNITLLDISPVLTAALKQKFSNTTIEIITGDFFEHSGQYDLILEQTFFCALDPSHREAYVKHMFSLLKKTGRLAGVLFNRAFEGGPPFGGSKELYEKLFNQSFTIKKMELCYNSIEPRSGTELFFILEK